MSSEQTDLEKRHQELDKKTDHELLVQIALELHVLGEILSVILVDLDGQKIDGVKVHGDSHDGSLGRIAADLHLLRRKLAGPTPVDPEEQ